MAVTLVNASGYQWGIESAEAGINVSNFTPTYRPEFKNFLQSKQDEKIGFALGEVETEFQIEGEVSGSTGLMAATFDAALTIANDDDLFGASTGGIYLDEATEPQERGGWRRVSLRASRNKGIA